MSPVQIGLKLRLFHGPPDPVRGENDAAPIRLEIAHDIVHELRAFRVETRVWLVEKREPDRPDQQLSQRQALAHSGRKRPEPLCRHRGQPHPFQSLLHKLCAGVEARHSQREAEVFGGGKFVIQVAAHGQEACLSPKRASGLERLTKHLSLARGGGKKAGQNLQQSGFTGSVRSGESQCSTKRNVQRDIVKGPVPAEPLSDASKPDGFASRGAQSQSVAPIRRSMSVRTYSAMLQAGDERGTDLIRAH